MLGVLSDPGICHSWGTAVSPRPANTRAIRRRNQRILAASDVCHICGHPGSDAVDHVIPIARRPDLADDEANLAPAHHTDPCPTCGVKCNRVKSDKPFAPVIRRSGSLRRGGAL